MSLQRYLEKLEVKHLELDTDLQAEIARPMPNFAIVTMLKKKKLRVKDMIGRVAQRSGFAQARGT